MAEKKDENKNEVTWLITTLLEDESADYRMDAAMALGEIGDKRAVSCPIKNPGGG